MSDTLIPAASFATPKSPETPQNEIPDGVSADEADAAATALGMVFFSADKAKKLKLIGAYQAQQGVVHLGLGRLAAAENAIQRMLETAVEISQDEDTYVEDRVKALLAGNALVSSLQKGIQMAVEFQLEKLISGPQSTKKRSFVDDQPVVPIQAQAGSTVNVTIDAPKKPVQNT